MTGLSKPTPTTFSGGGWSPRDYSDSAWGWMNQPINLRLLTSSPLILRGANIRGGSARTGGFAGAGDAQSSRGGGG